MATPALRAFVRVDLSSEQDIIKVPSSFMVGILSRYCPPAHNTISREKKVVLSFFCQIYKREINYLKKNTIHVYYDQSNGSPLRSFGGGNTLEVAKTLYPSNSLVLLALTKLD